MFPPLLPTTMCHPIFLLLRHLLSCSTRYHHQRPFELLLNQTLLQGTTYIVFRMTRHIYKYVCSYIPDSQKEKVDPTFCLAACRSEKQAQQLNRSIWKASSAISSNIIFMDNMHTAIMVNYYFVFCWHCIYFQCVTLPDRISVLNF